MKEKLEKKTEESINKILDEGITTNNLEHLYKLAKINKIAKEEENMNYGRGSSNYGEYGNYGGRGPGHGSYGEYNDYGRENYGMRGVDSRYRGHESLDRMYGEYGRYNESRNRYGANDQETDKSFHYMVEALKDFIKVLYEEAETPQQKQKVRDAIQQSMM